MNYNLKGTDVSITDELRSYVEKKGNTVSKFMFDADAARIDVELSYIETEEKQYRAEFTLHDKKIVRSVAHGSTLHEAIDGAAGELSRELTKDKRKRLHNLRQGAFKVKEFLRGFRTKI